MKVKNDWNIQASSLSMNSVNVIRNIVEHMDIKPNPEKKMIPLSIGKFFFFLNYDLIIFLINDSLYILIR